MHSKQLVTASFLQMVDQNLLDDLVMTRTTTTVTLWRMIIMRTTMVMTKTTTKNGDTDDGDDHGDDDGDVHTADGNVLLTMMLQL